jgi:hypothetical protein
MGSVNCSTIRDLFTSNIAEQTTVQQVGSLCIVTLAIPTIDARFVDVYVEPRNADFFLVHDGGKALNELILQGVSITDRMERRFSALARGLGVNWSDETFQLGCKIDRLYSVAMAIGMCSAIAVTELVGHTESIEEEPVREQTDHALRQWGGRKVKITRDEIVRGKLMQHEFDFVARSKHNRPISVNVLSPGSAALGAAQRFGFKVQDIEKTEAALWPRVVVQARAESWTLKANNLLQLCADFVLPIRSSEMVLPPLISEAMEMVLRKKSA